MSKDKYYFVYKTTNIINRKIYIGVHSTYDLDDGYLGSGTAIKRAIDKYGKDCFHRTIIKFVKSSEAAYILENTIVDDSFINRPDTYNIKIGGRGGWPDLHDEIIVNDINDNILRVSKYDDRIKNGELISIHKGKICAKDIEDNISYIKLTDPRYISGELVGIYKGMVTVIDKLGKTMSVTVNDPRYISGELIHVATGKLVVTDSNGNKLYISNDDPRYLSGELVAESKGRKYKHKNKRKIIKCPHCGVEGDISNMKRWHLDNCKHR